MNNKTTLEVSYQSFSTQLKNNVLLVLEKRCGFSTDMTPKKYAEYSKIRRDLSIAMGKSRGLGIIEFNKGIERLKEIDKQLEVYGEWK